MIGIQDLVEVTLTEADDFLKVRETLTRIGVASKKDKHFFNRAIFYTSKVNITLYTLKSCLHWMVSQQI